MTITAGYQIEIQSLVMGSGTIYGNAKLVTGMGIPSLRSSDFNRAQRHGEQFYGDYMTARTLTFEFHVLGDTAADVEAAVLALKGAWAPTQDDITMNLRLADQEFVMTGRPRGVEVGLAKLARGPRATAVCRFEASDPRLYVADLSTLNGTVPSASGGFTFPATAPFSFGAGGGGVNLVATNDGTIDTPWQAVISGPCTNPRLETDGGEYLDLDITLAAGDTLTLDSTDRTVLLNGTTSYYSALSPTSQWWDLPPGSTTMTFRADSPTGDIVLTYRTAYI